MISHHLLQLLLLTDWTKRETDPTETFHVFFFLPCGRFCDQMHKKTWNGTFDAGVNLQLWRLLFLFHCWSSLRPLRPFYHTSLFSLPAVFLIKAAPFLSPRMQLEKASPGCSPAGGGGGWSSHSWTFDVSTRTMLSGWNLKGALITFLPPRSPQPFIF